ncbi:hypothetical protein A4A49_51897 [Nicotiana attenuata]|uniref:Uncharacterized protein n=1 Tax=Nicotiana attenuata TaxID=49451 RepID=A0A1J6L5X8_NICAT|nr:hypothetical protein A4A49_51897 [Nicotiana attenuata]
MSSQPLKLLETLELSYFYSFRHLEINNPNLKRLKLKDSWPLYEEGDHTLEIVAPYLQHLEISGDIDDVKCRLVNVSSLVSVELTFDVTCVLFMLQLDEMQMSNAKVPYNKVQFEVASLLRASPHVETLNIDMESYVLKGF